MSRPMTKYRCPEEEVNKHLSFLHFRLIKYSTAFGSPDVMWEPDVYRLERATLQLQYRRICTVYPKEKRLKKARKTLLSQR